MEKIEQKTICDIDRSNMFMVLRNFHLQIKDAVQIASNIKFPKKLRVSNIIVNGLGGSAIGGDLVRSYLHYIIKIPFTVNRSYFLPAYANRETLSIISSYSGNTEETISAYKDSLKRKCKILAISSGGEVEKIAKKNGNIFIKIPTGFQPRCALGYSFFTIFISLFKLGLIPISQKVFYNEIESVIQNLEKYSKQFSNYKLRNNIAIKIASEIKGKLPVIYSSSDLLDVVNLRWRGQISENSKQLAYGNLYPEMNHNELVGWWAPEKTSKNKSLNRRSLLNDIIVIFLKDNDDYVRIKLRMDITSEIYKKLASKVISIKGKGENKLERIFNLIYTGDWVSYYLALMRRVDPTPVEVISYLKSKLK
ncbi:MAG: bifunctional phosphoglucose/phosphomannose isomerase [Ignavibacteria bacterium]|nr:bifunctional phosphoglucose/phosphomannose isomerase [Ignavibacteria bacterium]